MTAIDFDSGIAGTTRGKKPGFFRTLLARWEQRAMESAAVFELSQMDTRLLRDMGIEPMDVYDAIRGKRRSTLFYPMRRSAHE